MGKKFKSHQPYKETLDTYKEIEKYIKEENDAKKDKFSFKQKKVKMPYKMYMGIKKAVINKIPVILTICIKSVNFMKDNIMNKRRAIKARE